MQNVRVEADLAEARQQATEASGRAGELQGLLKQQTEGAQHWKARTEVISRALHSHT